MTRITEMRGAALAVAVVLALCGGAASAQRASDEQGARQPGAAGQQAERAATDGSARARNAADEPLAARETQTSTFGTSNARLDDVVEQRSDLSEFVAAVKAAGLEGMLLGGEVYTVFAPTNDVLDDDDIDDLMKPENREDLVKFMRAHITADVIDLEAPNVPGETKTLDGNTVDIDRDRDEIEVGDATVLNREAITVGRARIYAIDDDLA